MSGQRSGGRGAGAFGVPRASGALQGAQPLRCCEGLVQALTALASRVQGRRKQASVKTGLAELALELERDIGEVIQLLDGALRG